MPSQKNWISSHNVNSEHQWRGCLSQISQTMIRSTTSAVRSIDRTLENSTMINERALISVPSRDRDHIILDQKRFVLSYQRDEILYADHSSTEVNKLLWDTSTIQLYSTRFTDDFESVESLLIMMMPAFKAINVSELVIPELSDQSMPVFIDGLSATAVMASVMAESQQDTSIISVSEGHTLTATSSATVTRAYIMLEFSNQLHTYLTKPLQDSDIITAAERSISMIECSVAKDISKKHTLDNTIRMLTTSLSKKAKTRASTAASNKVINVKKDQTIRWDAETVTYISWHRIFSVSQILTEFNESLHSLLQTQINNLCKDLSLSIFRSALKDLELKSLDLHSNGNLFPTLINKEGELREWAIKVSASQDSKTSTEAAYTVMIRKLTLKANTFWALTETASKQEKIYLTETELLRATNEDTERADKMQFTDAELSAIIKSVKLTITAEEWNNLLNLLVNHLTTLVKRYCQKLSVLIVYLHCIIQELNKWEISLSSLLHYTQNTIKQDSSLTTIFPQFIMKLESSVYVCQCTACKATTSLSIIHNELELKATTPPSIIHEKPELEPSLKEEKKKNVLNYEKMPGSWWYWDISFVAGALFLGVKLLGCTFSTPPTISG